jgi:hypothetical protein
MFASALKRPPHAPNLGYGPVCDLPGRHGYCARVLQAFAPSASICKGISMNRVLLTATLLAALCIAGCDKPTVVNVPAVPAAAPGPAGPAGATGATGATGSPGEAGKPGDGTTVIVTPPAASAPTN